MIRVLLLMALVLPVSSNKEFDKNANCPEAVES